MLVETVMALEAIPASRLAADLADARAQVAALQSQNVQLARLTATELTAMSLAHELSQPLSAILNYLRAAQRLAGSMRQDETERLGAALEGAMAQTVHAGQIIHGLRDFVTRGETDKHVESAARLVRAAVSLALPETERNRVLVSLTFDPQAGLVLVDRVQIEQVLGNLIRNAVRAMQDSPRKVLQITTRRLDGDVEICVTDSGHGLPDSVRRRLYEPFVTTRPDGTGLGLAICRAIVEAHGGTLSWQSAPDGGCMFRFTVAGAADTLA